MLSANKVSVSGNKKGKDLFLEISFGMDSCQLEKSLPEKGSVLYVVFEERLP